jgi:carboxylesterase
MSDTSPHFQNPYFDSSPFLFQGGSSGVLLTHGLSATPVEVRMVAEYLHRQGYTVSGPRLPGHGTSVEELNRCTWHDWVDHVTVAYEELDSRCERVFVGGESTGGLLALYLGSAHQEITGLITYAPALRASRRLMYLTPLLKYFVKAVEKKRAGHDPDSIVNQRWQGYTKDAVPALAQLLALQRHVKRRLSRITQPLLVLQGRLDTTLDIHGAQEVVDRVNSADKEMVWLEQSSHCLALDVEWEKAAEITLTFIQRIEKRG